MITRGIALLTALILAGCVQHKRVELFPPKPDLPYRAWYVGLGAPDYMEAWVDGVDLTDVNDLMYERVFGGVASTSTPPDNRGDAHGWPKRPGPGSQFPMSGIDLPEKITVRWQSLAEPEAYRASINVPKWVRDEMRTERRVFCRFDNDFILEYRSIIAIGVAPGGVAKFWLMGSCLDPMEIGRVQGEVNPVGPYNGTSNGEFYRPPSPNAQHYIDTHGIPFGSW
ncbi:DUF2931 family protein [Halopseudomonas aestusnigri]|uniref:DUF2931 family protein n=1 Tax=Halopseudomonas aestusnigri TaxID=857252 RepID=UPI000C637524|nr:hypothetical protein [Pseudomonadales bacterium]MAP77520.1 hypothetical protein [Pseudomonadales bacterium]MAY08034.1 hypothetical protein [Pseudomonadales bacterium]HBT55752.1 hypothetical protein [Pseudomonas sp.]HCP04038.1 hypothetical protein [Pseudomonas sp.]